MANDIYEPLRPFYEKAMEGTRFTLVKSGRLEHDTFPISITLPGIIGSVGCKGAEGLFVYLRAPLDKENDIAGMIAAVQRLSRAHDYMIARNFKLISGPSSHKGSISINYCVRINSKEELPIKMSVRGSVWSKEIDGLSVNLNARLGYENLADRVATLQRLSRAHDHMISKGFRTAEIVSSQGSSGGNYGARIYSEKDLQERIRDAEQSMIGNTE